MRSLVLDWRADSHLPTGKGAPPSEERTGWLCVREVDFLVSDPVCLVRWWPVARHTLETAEDRYPLGQEMKRAENTGGYHMAWTPAHAPRPLYIGAHGPGTVPVETVEVEVPKPKGNGKFRWNYGTWQRLGKNGWVDVPMPDLTARITGVAK